MNVSDFYLQSVGQAGHMICSPPTPHLEWSVGPLHPFQVPLDDSDITMVMKLCFTLVKARSHPEATNALYALRMKIILPFRCRNASWT